MDRGVTDANRPDLGTRPRRLQPFARRKDCVVNRELARLDVDGHDAPDVTRL
jgi:hypothetical protein